MKINKEEFIKAVDRFIEKHNVTVDVAKESLKQLGPQKLGKMGILESDGWRAGYTKKSIEKRVEINRRKEKNRRRVNAANRKNK